MVVIPQWFVTEVVRRLTDVTQPDRSSPQHYARCPVARHADKRRSFAFKPGDAVPLVYRCHVDCTDEEIRGALLALGVPEDCLGIYGTPEHEMRRQKRSAIQEWREVERLRYELADLKNGIRGLMVSDLSLAMLKVRLLAVVDDVDIPVSRKDYVDFAMRAGVSQPRAYAAWKADPLGGQAQTECASGDHVVLTQPGENSQAPQVGGHDAIIEARKPLSKREEIYSRNDNSRNDKSDRDEAMTSLRNAGLTGNEAA